MTEATPFGKAPVDDEAVARMYATRAGWLLPDGSVLPADRLLEHVDALRKSPFVDRVAQFDREMEEVEKGIELTQELDDPDDGPMMHRFDGLRDEPRDRLIRDLYDAGLVRIGIRTQRTWDPERRRHTVGTVPTQMEAEGLRETIDLHERRLTRIARTMGCELVPIRYVVYEERMGTEKGERRIARLTDDPDQLDEQMRWLGLLPKLPKTHGGQKSGPR